MCMICTYTYVDVVVHVCYVSVHVWGCAIHVWPSVCSLLFLHPPQPPAPTPPCLRPQVMLMNRLKLSSKIESVSEPDGADIDESASGPIVFHPVKRPSILTTSLDVPNKKMAAT